MTTVSAIYPPGKYYIGDLSYALKEDIYTDFWGKKNNFNAGTFEVIEENGTKYRFSVAHTAYGDGWYEDSVSGKSYFVDAGCIAIIPFPLCENSNNIIGGHFIESTSDINFEASKGVFAISYNMTDKGVDMIVIDTFNIDSECDSTNGNGDSDDDYQQCECDECLENRPN